MCLNASFIVVSGGVTGVVVGDDHYTTKFLLLVLKIFDARAHDELIQLLERFDFQLQISHVLGFIRGIDMTDHKIIAVGE